MKLSQRVGLVAFTFAWAWAILAALTRPEPASWFAYHMSYHEKWYPAILAGQVDRWLPPGYVLAAKLLPGLPGVVALRLVSLASCAVLGVVVSRFAGWREAVWLLSGPFLVVFGSRAQPDALMLCLGLVGVLLAKRCQEFLGGFLLGLSASVKPVFVLAALVVKPSWQWCFGLFVGLLPFLAWLWLNQGAIGLHGAKSQPFEDALRLLVVLPFVLAGSALLPVRRGWPLLGAVVFLAFAFYKAPVGHEYYLVPALALFALAQDTSVAPARFWAAVAINSAVAWVAIVFLGAVAW